MENPIRGGQKPCQNNYGRDRSIDIAKGIGIILVVYGHLVNPIHREIFLFHMPLFFLLSGYFFSTEKGWTTFLFRLCIEKGNLYESFCVGIYDEVSRQFISINTPLWFLLALFEIFIISFLTEKYVKKVWVKIIITGIITLIGYESAMHERYTIIPFLSQACMGYIFFRIGYWLKMKNTLKKKVSIFAISLLILGYGIGAINSFGIFDPITGFKRVLFFYWKDNYHRRSYHKWSNLWFFIVNYLSPAIFIHRIDSQKTISFLFRRQF